MLAASDDDVRVVNVLVRVCGLGVCSALFRLQREASRLRVEHAFFLAAPDGLILGIG